MALTALELSPEELKKYHPWEAYRKRKAETRVEVAKRRRRAMNAARKAAKLLKEKFGAQEVILFGSLARRGSFNLYSDIDLAVRGIPSDQFYAAVGLIITFDMEFDIDLIELEACPVSLKQNIEKYGKPL
jgi:predicted nucleotidyltransferase